MEEGGRYSLVHFAGAAEDARLVDDRDARAAERLRAAIRRFVPLPVRKKVLPHGTQTTIASVAGKTDGTITKALDRGTSVFNADVLFGFAVFLDVNLEHLYRYLRGDLELDRLAGIREASSRADLDLVFRLTPVYAPPPFRRSGKSGTRKATE
jgi:hypothetical protein